MCVAAVAAAGNATITINTAAFVGFLTFEASDDGGMTYYPIAAAREDATGQDQTVIYNITALYQRIWLVALAGVTHFRVRCSSFTSGTAVIRITPGPLLVEPNPICTSIPVDGLKTTYSSGALWSPTATTATDILTVAGSATRIIKITRLDLAFWATTAGPIASGTLVRRSAANTGGTSSAAPSMSVDTNDAQPTAVVSTYTVNPTALGAGTNVRAFKVSVPVNTSQPGTVVFDFAGGRPTKLPTLRGANQMLCVNLGSASIVGLSAAANVEWTEESF
jgi:hypothetical protein